MKFKLTKTLKENWITALKSGEYEQFGGELMNPVNPKQCCCLGVLAHIHPDIKIDDNGRYCIVRNKNKGYIPFEEMNIHNSNYRLADINDGSYRDGIRDYSAVIPIIETLPTVD